GAGGVELGVGGLDGGQGQARGLVDVVGVDGGEQLGGLLGHPDVPALHEARVGDGDLPGRGVGGVRPGDLELEVGLAAVLRDTGLGRGGEDGERVGGEGECVAGGDGERAGVVGGVGERGGCGGEEDGGDGQGWGGHGGARLWFTRNGRWWRRRRCRRRPSA